MLLAVLAASGAVALGVVSHFTEQISQAHRDLQDGQAAMDKGEWEAADNTLRRGLSAARSIPFQRDLAADLERRLHRVGQARNTESRVAVARDLHRLSDRIRFFYGEDSFARGVPSTLEARSRLLWENRRQLVENLRDPGSAALEPVVRDDLLDLAIFWANLQVQLSPSTEIKEARHKALTVLAEADALLGPSCVLDEEAGAHETHKCPGDHRGGMRGPFARTGSATAWEHYALARSHLRRGDLDRAAEEAAWAVRLEPQGLWPNFYQGVCMYQLGRYEDAVAAFSVCIGAAPAAAVCFYNRALALERLGRVEQAHNDYDQALRLDPTLAAAALNRGMLHYRDKHYDAALKDLQRARELGADPLTVSLGQALANLGRGERAAALDNLRKVLSHDPHQAKARKLYDSLSGH
jgi:tetratricopeptide (TPR) repeat protein